MLKPDVFIWWFLGITNNNRIFWMHGKIHNSALDMAVYQTMLMLLAVSDQMASNKQLAFSHRTKWVIQDHEFLNLIFFIESSPQNINQNAHSNIQVKPNLDSRIEPSDSTAGNSPSGYFGVQTSSFSSSSDVNGIKKHKEGATTTVNDNGKVSTYTVENWCAQSRSCDDT